MPAVPIGEIVALVGGRYDGPPDLTLHGIAPLSEATPEQLSFLANPKYSAQVPATTARRPPKRANSRTRCREAARQRSFSGDVQYSPGVVTQARCSKCVGCTAAIRSVT